VAVNVFVTLPIMKWVAAVTGGPPGAVVPNACTLDPLPLIETATTPPGIFNGSSAAMTWLTAERSLAELEVAFVVVADAAGPDEEPHAHAPTNAQTPISAQRRFLECPATYVRPSVPALP
jgi:hypothetical protein